MRGAAVLLLLVLMTGCQGVTERMATRDVEQVVRLMHDEHFPDQRRKGIDQAVAREVGRRPPYTDMYRSMAVNDPDFLVRATAIRALNRSRDAGATEIFVRALNDRNEPVRLEAAKALIALPDPEAVPRLVEMVAEERESTDVRIAAAEALVHYRRVEVARALVAVLPERRFGVAWQARQALRAMTDRDFEYDQGAWLGYIAGPERPFG